jgi:hypothetical protein
MGAQQDLRREPLETRKATLASLLRRCRPGVRHASTLSTTPPRSSSTMPAPSAAKAS